MEVHADNVRSGEGSTYDRGNRNLISQPSYARGRTKTDPKVSEDDGSFHRFGVAPKSNAKPVVHCNQDPP